jgi:hypothetical protein
MLALVVATGASLNACGSYAPATLTQKAWNVIDESAVGNLMTKVLAILLAAGLAAALVWATAALVGIHQ